MLDCRTRFVPHPAVPLFGSMNRYGLDALLRTPETHTRRSPMNDIRMLIGAERCASASGATFERCNPLDGKPATRAPAATPQDALQAVEAAAKAFPEPGPPPAPASAARCC